MPMKGYRLDLSGTPTEEWTKIIKHLENQADLSDPDYHTRQVVFFLDESRSVADLNLPESCPSPTEY